MRERSTLQPVRIVDGEVVTGNGQPQHAGSTEKSGTPPAASPYQPQAPGLPLFGGVAAVYSESRGRGFDALTAAARAKVGVPNWEWYAWEVLDGTSRDALVTGGIPSNPTAKSGTARWRGVTPQKVVVTDADMVAASVEYERTTGICSECVNGERWKGWSRDTGHRYVPCTRCNATGRSTGETAP